MDFRVGEDQRELAEGIRAMVAGRLPLDHLRAREGDACAIDAGGLGRVGRDGRLRPDAARARRHRPRPWPKPSSSSKSSGARWCPGPLVGTFLAARADMVEGAAEGRVQVGVHCLGGAGPVLVEHLGSLGRAARLRGRWSRAGDSCCLRSPPRRRDAGGDPLDPLTPLWRLDALPAGRPVPGDDGSPLSLWRDGALLTAALQVGHAAEALDLAVAYAKERQQFGKPIGSFQAVKHMCADMLGARRGGPGRGARRRLPGRRARRRRHRGGRGRDAPPASCWTRSVGGAKLLADEAALGNARAAIQVHGGMGFTWEVPLHLHLKRARVLSTTFGTPADARHRPGRLRRSDHRVTHLVLIGVPP